MTWVSLLLGCSGLVIGVGRENDGLSRSTRLVAGATGRQPLPLSGLMQVGPAGMVAGADLLAPEDAPGPVQALVSSTSARPSSLAAGRRRRPGRGVGDSSWPCGMAASFRRGRAGGDPGGRDVIGVCGNPRPRHLTAP